MLYFLNLYLNYQKIPKNLLDANIKTDYQKLKHLIILDKQLNGNFSILKQITEQGEIAANIEQSFSVEDLLMPDKFISLLYYFGLISIAGSKRGKPLMKIPNKTIETFFGEYIRNSYKDANVFKIDVFKYSLLVENMAYEGKWKEVFQFLSEEVKKQSKIRDYISGEDMIKGFLLAYLNITDHFVIATEKEFNKGFADFYIEPFFIKYKDMPFSYIIELKYIERSKTKNLKTEVNRLVKEATAQLHKYAKDKYVIETKGNTELKKIVLVYNAWELVYFEEV